MDIDFDYTHKDFVYKRPKLIIELASWITPIMNEIHGLSHSDKFWLRILRNHLKICVNRMHLLKEDQFVPQAYLLPVNSFEKPTLRQIRAIATSYIGRGLIRSGRRRRIFEAITKNNNICFGPRGMEIAEDIDGIFIKEYYPLLLLGDGSCRRLTQNIAKNIDDTFLKNVVLTLPKIYVEYFMQHYEAVKVINPKMKIFHIEHVGSEFTEILMAKYVDEGAIIFLYQAGCGHGETDYFPDETEYSTIERYITYGWKRHKKDQPGRAFRLESFAKKYYQFKSSSNKHSYDAILVYSVYDEKIKEHYKNFTKFFLENIDRHKYSELLLRARPKSRYINNRKELNYLNIPKDVHIDSGKRSMAEVTALSKVNILVFTMATNLYECIHCEQPVIAYNMMVNPSEIFRPYLDYFKHVGILHDDYSSLVNHLNSIDMNEWWEMVKQDSEFKEFQNKFTGKRNVNSY